MHRLLHWLLAALCALTAVADVVVPPSPASGPASGGTAVALQGDYSNEVVYFGERAAVETRPVAGGVIAVTPPHPPGVVQIRTLANGRFVTTGWTFEFVAGATEIAYTRLLLPVFTPPIAGAFGSEFHTALNAVNTAESEIHVYGLREGDELVRLRGLASHDPEELADHAIIPLGTPGRLIEIPATQARLFDANLRAFDTSRNAETYGTQIPVVDVAAFRTRFFALTDVPLDPRFRKTLRLYAAGPTTATVIVRGTPHAVHQVTLTGGGRRFEPAYAQFTDFPVGSGTTTVVVDPVFGGLPVWGFISVTNNETQQITIVTPR